MARLRVWLSVPIFCWGGARVPDENYEANERRWQDILHEVTALTQAANHVESDTVLLRRALYELRKYLNGALKAE